MRTAIFAVNAISLLFLVFLNRAFSENIPCVPRVFLHGSVCVCNATYCDTLEHLEGVEVGKYVLVTSSAISGDRFSLSNGEFSVENKNTYTEKFTSVSDDVLEITVYRNHTYQSIIGFGGAFTDSTGKNINDQPEALRDTIIEQYFGPNGLEYNIGRVPMGGADFSMRGYTYDDVEGDENLDYFALTVEDHILKIPFIKKARELRNDLKLFASVWTAPKWMKTNNEYYGKGSLKQEYYPHWANYFIKFLDAYDKEEVSFWAITTQNEPLHGYTFDFGFNCMGWTAEQQREWVKGHLGPRLAESKYKDIVVIMYDDQRLHLKEFTDVILNDPEAAKYISGIGVHWYTNGFVSPGVLTDTHNKYPEYFLLATEACAGAMPWSEDVVLGSWNRAANYASDIIKDLNNFVGGWVDWNLVLDLTGGPNWRDNFVDAPMISNSSAQEVYKQPIFYALGHFSKFIPEKSSRIHHVKMNGGNATLFSGLEIVTCLRPDGAVTTVFLNRLNKDRAIRILDAENGHGPIDIILRGQSISTLVYKPENEAVDEETTENENSSGTTHQDQAFLILSIALSLVLTRI